MEHKRHTRQGEREREKKCKKFLESKFGLNCPLQQVFTDINK